jgi:hypothetical protein
MLYSLKYFAICPGPGAFTRFVPCVCRLALASHGAALLVSAALPAPGGWTHCNGARRAFLDRSTTLDTILVEGKRKSDEVVSC